MLGEIGARVGKLMSFSLRNIILFDLSSPMVFNMGSLECLISDIISSATCLCNQPICNRCIVVLDLHVDTRIILYAMIPHQPQILTLLMPEVDLKALILPKLFAHKRLEEKSEIQQMKC